MKLLWVKTDFLHPTNRGGQIRTLETLRHLHRNHEVHYVAYRDPAQPEGVERAPEYCSFAYPVDRPPSKRGTPRFFFDLAKNLSSPLPLAVGRFATPEMKAQIESLMAQQNFDSVVCDFLAPSANFADLSRCVLFQHNVETVIWRRHAEHGATPLHNAYFRLQAERMFACERNACLSAAHVIAVSETDAMQMKQLFGVKQVSQVATGVDIEYFARPQNRPRQGGLVFIGAMDWLPNIDGARWFVHSVLPLIRKKIPTVPLVLAGRSPVPELFKFASADPLITVTGTVPDVRPYLWDAAVSIVPLRIGGGTRLKIYESMAASAPVVSTTVGAEGLSVRDGVNIAIADTPETFAGRCISLLESEGQAASLARAALELTATHFSWNKIAADFEAILRSPVSELARAGGQR